MTKPAPERPQAQQASQHMHCMEVWGGHQLTSRGVEFGGLDAWVYSKPYGEATHGGDVYYASSCATGRITRLLLADVSGHGQTAAAPAADLRTLMRRFVNRLDQTEFVNLLNQQFTEMSKVGTFATAVVTTFFAPSRRLTVCNAGHPRPLLYTAAERKWNFLGKQSQGNLPLGLIDATEYEQFDVELAAGDCVVSYSDALIESSDADGEMLGENGLLKIMRLIGEVEPERLIETLLREVGERYPQNLSDDDVTVMVVRVNGREPAYSWGEKANALWRFLGTFARSFQAGAEKAPFPDFNLPNVGGAIFPALARRWRARK